MKRHGYILFRYVNYPELKSIEIHESFLCSKGELKSAHFNDFDDKWDLPNRHLIHWFFLDLKQMRFFPMEKWKSPYVYKKGDRYNFCNKTEMSKIVFKDKEREG